MTKRKGFVWRLLHHIFAMYMKSCEPSCPFYIFLPLFMNCCVSRWEIRTVVRPVFEQVSPYSYYCCFEMLCLLMFCDGFAWSKMDLLVPWMESWLWNSWQGVPVGTDTPWEEYLFHPPFRQVVHTSMNYLRGVFQYGGSNKALWLCCTVLCGCTGTSQCLVQRTQPFAHDWQAGECQALIEQTAGMVRGARGQRIEKHVWPWHGARWWWSTHEGPGWSSPGSLLYFSVN